MAKGNRDGIRLNALAAAKPSKFGPDYPPLVQEKNLIMRGAPDWWSHPNGSLRRAKNRKLH